MFENKFTAQLFLQSRKFVERRVVFDNNRHRGNVCVVRVCSLLIKGFTLESEAVHPASHAAARALRGHTHTIVVTL